MKESINQFRGKHSFLSNFYPSTIVYRDMIYPTVEHAYQAAKCLYLKDRIAIQKASTPSEAKKLGRTAKMVSNWYDIRLSVMLDLLRIKFQDPALEAMLIKTDNAWLCEENCWNDKFWGTTKGVGENNLGKLLMKIRAELTKEK